jgi:transmembrane sensor
MNKNLTYKTLRDFALGKYSWTDFLKIKNWINNPDDNKEAGEILYDHWSELISQPDKEGKSLKHIYEKIDYRILLEERSKSKKRDLWAIYRQVAAILLVPVIAFLLYFTLPVNRPDDDHTAWVEIVAPQSSRIQFSLPDGSSGWLNSGSILSYNPSFSKKREVVLSGEAYFDVIPSEKDFHVNAGDLDICVLGTRFNVSAYPDDDFAYVVLASGKVMVRGEKQVFECTLLPSQKLTVYPAENKYNVRDVDVSSFTAWKDGLLLLDNEPFELAVNRIERWYNVDMVIEDQKLKNYRFKATFQDEPLEEVLKLLSVSTPMEYSFEKRQENQAGIYMKKKVKIKLKQ